MPPKPEMIAGADGIVRPRAAEDQLNRICADVLESPSGRLLFEYLRSITLNAVCGPAVSDAELRHREGQRHLVQILDDRRLRGITHRSDQA